MFEKDFIKVNEMACQLMAAEYFFCAPASGEPAPKVWRSPVVTPSQTALTEPFVKLELAALDAEFAAWKGAEPDWLEEMARMLAAHRAVAQMLRPTAPAAAEKHAAQADRLRHTMMCMLLAQEAESGSGLRP